MKKTKIICILAISICIGSFIGSFAASNILSSKYEVQINKKIEHELNTTIERYLNEYSGCGTTDMFSLFEDYPEITNWTDFETNINMSNLFEDYSKKERQQ